MRTIWKAEIKPNSVRGEAYGISVRATINARAVSVGLQHGIVCVWFEAETTMEDDVLTIWCVGTGFGKVPDGKRFIGTVIDGPHVWHFYADE